MDQVFAITEFIVDSFIHIWPYLVVTIPIAVFVNVSGVSKYINKALSQKPILSILLATLVGALSPFCSCGIIPIITTLLIGGIPLAPVMSFWIASPSMDPEIFFLSTATIGWKLSVWRLVATFVISLLSGYITHLFVQKNWLGEDILKKDLSKAGGKPIFSGFKGVVKELKLFFKRDEIAVCSQEVSLDYEAVSCCSSNEKLINSSRPKTNVQRKPTCISATCKEPTISLQKRLFNETMNAVWMIVKFMALAFFINALIQFYVPRESISSLLGGEGVFSVVTASLIGIPFYTSNVTAIPLISGLLQMGMNEGAALAFLISGPITTLPAMAAVWGLVRRKMFLLYLGFALVGSLMFGMLINFLG